MSKRKHRVRRGGIAVIPIVISIIFSLLIPVNVTAESFFASLQVIIGVWATLLGFIITTVSILLTFTGSKLTEEIKATGHYKTILFSYLLTCFELLIFLLLSFARINYRCLQRHNGKGSDRGRYNFADRYLHLPVLFNTGDLYAV